MPVQVIIAFIADVTEILTTKLHFRIIFLNVQKFDHTKLMDIPADGALAHLTFSILKESHEIGRRLFEK